MKGSDVQEAREDPGRPDRKAYIQQKSVYRIQQKPRGRGARQRGPSGRLSRKAPTKRSQNSERGDARVQEKRETFSNAIEAHVAACETLST